MQHTWASRPSPLSSLSLPRNLPCPIHSTPLLAPATTTSAPPLAVSLSHRPNVSLSPFNSLSLPLTRFSLFLLQTWPYGIINGNNEFRYTADEENQRRSRWGKPAPWLPKHHQQWRSTARGRPWEERPKKRRLRPPPLSFQGSNQLLSTSLSYWYPPFAMKVLGLAACFFVQIYETLTVDLSQTEPYFELTISNC